MTNHTGDSNMYFAGSFVLQRRTCSQYIDSTTSHTGYLYISELAHLGITISWRLRQENLPTYIYTKYIALTYATVWHT